ncbi:hypothetical protein LTR85_011265 [Meristemomyces frigidus]|nr:hypothetical protein LTR85_011265 [Meristemomyces frigidus]
MPPMSHLSRRTSFHGRNDAMLEQKDRQNIEPLNKPEHQTIPKHQDGKTDQRPAQITSHDENDCGLERPEAEGAAIARAVEYQKTHHEQISTRREVERAAGEADLALAIGLSADTLEEPGSHAEEPPDQEAPDEDLIDDCGHPRHLLPPHRAGDSLDDMPACVGCCNDQICEVDIPAYEAEEEALVSQIDQLEQRLETVRLYGSGLKVEVPRLMLKSYRIDALQTEYDRRNMALPRDLRVPRDFYREHAQQTDFFLEYLRNREEAEREAAADATRKADAKAAEEAGTSKLEDLEDTSAMSSRYPRGKALLKKAGLDRPLDDEKDAAVGPALQVKRRRNQALETWTDEPEPEQPDVADAEDQSIHGSTEEFASEDELPSALLARLAWDIEVDQHPASAQSGVAPEGSAGQQPAPGEAALQARSIDVEAHSTQTAQGGS